ncbi:MAG: very short patch repair endonuclease [Candidatus Limisoma sp.]
MTDVLSKEQRKRCMSHVRGKDTKPEVMVRQFLFAQGFRYRLYRKDLPGKPDIVLPKYRTVIFINGCFWHGHSGCKYATIPEANHDFWLAKISGNVERDKSNYAKLFELGWKVIEIWQCELKPKFREQTLNNLLTELRND